MRNAARKSICLAATAMLCFTTAALANVENRQTQGQSIGGTYTSPYSDPSSSVPAALISEELVKATSFTAPVVPMPEAPSAAVLGIDLLAVAGLVVMGRKI